MSVSLVFVYLYIYLSEGVLVSATKADLGVKLREGQRMKTTLPGVWSKETLVSEITRRDW